MKQINDELRSVDEEYDVIIVGGGPVGAALGIELGMNNIKTLILEKHGDPLLSPRAQYLNERSMELLMRWGLAEKLRAQSVSPKNYPMRGIWCSKLNGATYATAEVEDPFEANTVAQKPLRIPLYITENVLRSRLNTFECVTFLQHHEVESFLIKQHQVEVTVKNKAHQLKEKYYAKYIVGSDGANSMVRKFSKMPFKDLGPKRRAISVLFESCDLEDKITVKKGCLYYMIEKKTRLAMGPVNIKKGLWYAHIFYPGKEASIDDINVQQLTETLSGVKFKMKIVNQHFWDMQIQCADHFMKDDCVFLVGDAAHAFEPTGGFGLNTGLGDAVNLAWKLAAVVHRQSNPPLLKTYESERRPICIRNLEEAEKNARDASKAILQFPPDQVPEQFAKENVRIAKQHMLSVGLTLGYTYDQSAHPMKPSEYVPTTQSGYFLPNKLVSGRSIYARLSATHWTLIVCGKEKIKFQTGQLKIVHVPEHTYPSRYVLVRPDWHIVLASNEIAEKQVMRVIKGE